MDHRWLVLALIAMGCAESEPPYVEDTGVAGVLPGDLDFEASAVERIDVETVSGGITVGVGAEEGVRVDVVYVETDETYDYFLQDRVLSLWPVCSNGTVGCSSGFSVGASAAMSYRLETISGIVALDDYAGEVTVLNSNGTVRGQSLQAAAIVGSGDGSEWDLTFAVEPVSVDITTTAGPISVTVPRGEYTLDITTNGESTVTEVINGTGPLITLHSTSGDITVTGVE